MKKSYQLFVIGAGSGGLVSAAGASGLGLSVGLAEKHKMGGDCLNTGCVPSKAVIRTAKLAYDSKSARRFGLNIKAEPTDLNSVMASVKEVIQKIEPHDSVERFTSLGVDVYQDEYKFLSPSEVTNGCHTFSAQKIIIATGARPFVPPIKGLDQINYLTSDNVWELQSLPKRLIVLGGGPIGCELAQVFARLGSQVTLVEMADRLLVREDADASQVIVDQFKNESIHVLTQTKAVEVRGQDGGYQLITDHPRDGQRAIEFDHILVCVGRAPNIEKLNLETAGVEFSNKGIVVNDSLQTSNKNIYACGDVCSRYQFTHAADYQARLILRNAFFPGRSKANYRSFPWCTFTDPEVARVGLNEAEAQKQGIDYDIYSYALKDLDRAVCDREDHGFIKILTLKGKDQILGATLVGSHAGDIVHELVLAMHQNIGLGRLAAMVHIYPTLAEAAKRVADVYNRSKLTPRTKKILKWYFNWRFG